MKVSILIPCFNAERWIAEAIRSGLNQTWPHKEVIVVDDGSTDNSAKIIRSFGDAIRHEIGPNRGANVARNRLTDLAAGEWLQFLDADDYLLPEKIEQQMGEFDQSAVDIIYAPMILEHWSADASPRQEVQSISSPHDPWTELIRWSLPGTGSGIWRRSAILDVGGWKPDQPCCQEHELYLRLLSAGKRFQYCATPGLVYRQWSTATVCRRNPRETLERRLAIVEGAERFLTEHEQMTDGRRDAIAQTRVECARSLYQTDRAGAVRLVDQALRANRNFDLPRSSCFPPMYRFLYRVAGFRVAESVASIARPWRTERSR